MTKKRKRKKPWTWLMIVKILGIAILWAIAALGIFLKIWQYIIHK